MEALGASRIKYNHMSIVLRLYLMIMQRNRVCSHLIEYLGESQRTKLALSTESNLLEVLYAG